MMTDYKIVEEREQDGVIYQKVRYYFGEETTEDEYDSETGQVSSVTRYRRQGLLEEVEYQYAAV